MISLKPFILAAAAAFALSACQPAANTPANSANSNAPSANANTNAKAADPAAAAPTKDAIVAIEKKGWEAWKDHKPEVFGDIISSKYVGFGKEGRQDKAASIKAFTDAKCDIKSYSFSDDQLSMLGSDVAVLTFKAAQDGTCDGKKVPAAVWSSSIYVREGDGWKNVFYGENPAADPNAPAAKAAAPAAKAPAAAPADATKPDALTEALMAVETKAWEAWKARDAKAVEAMMADGFMYVSGTGRKDKAESVKAWSAPKCEGLGYTFSDPAGVSLSKDVAFVTYKAAVKGTCDGKPNQPALWVASFSTKDGETWKNAFYTDFNQ